MLSVKARETMRFAMVGKPAHPQFQMYKGKTYTVAEDDDSSEGTMPGWVALRADDLEVIDLIEDDDEDEKEKETKKPVDKPNKKAGKKG